MHNVRLHAVAGSPGALEHYEEWYGKVVNALPGVYHYSWIDLERKINSSTFNLQQLNFGKQAFVDALKASLEKESEDKE